MGIRTQMPRTKVSAKPAPRKQTELSHRGADIFGVILLAFAAIMIVALASARAGLLGDGLATFFSTLFGKGAWAVPVLAGIIGIGLLRGRGMRLEHLYWGLCLLFVSLLGFLAQPIRGDYFDPAAIEATGGYLGALIGWSMDSLLGNARYIGLAAIGVVGLVLCVDVPIRTMIENGRKRAKAVKDKIPTRAPKPLKPSDPESDRKRIAALTKHPVVEPEEEPLTRRAEPETKVRAPKTVIKDFAKTMPKDEPGLPTELSAPKEGYQLPPVSLLAEAIMQPQRSPAEMQANIETLEGTLEQFGIEANVVEVAAGPTVTRYEISLGPGVRVNRITALADNIAMDLAASQVRVEAPIPGKAAIGVEVPNAHPTTVTLRELCEAKEFVNHNSRLAFALGKDVSGANKYSDLTKMPHLLIGGATNSGKSIGLASLIMSILMRNTPKDVRMVMIDPKRVELTLFDHIPHLMCPVIKDVKEAAGVLRAVWREMDRRYDLFSNEGVRNIDSWNAKASYADRLPYIVVIIDELADLMIQCGAEVETVIVRLAQLARAVGIHLVIATQRPSVDVITGLIKANIPSRIAFSVASQIDSRTILDSKGAEALIGKGDMLYNPIDAIKPLRIQGAFVSEKEIDAVCRFWREQQKPEYTIEPIMEGVADAKKEGGDFGDEADPLWEEAVRWVVDRGQASTSMLQRKFSVGFQRASRLLDMMEERGIVGPRDGPRPREVLVNYLEVDALFNGGQVGPVYDVGGTLDDDEVREED